MDAFTTDPQLLTDDYEVLADPQLLFGSQNVVMTVDSGKLKVVGERKFLAVVDAVNSRLTQDVIVGLNAAVTGGRTDADVARQFLRDEGLLAADPPGRQRLNEPRGASMPEPQSLRRGHRPVHRAEPDARDRRARPGTANEDRQRTHASAWVPTTDIFALGDRLVIRIELAGVDPEEVELQLRQRRADRLARQPDRGPDRDTDEPTFYVRERFYGAFRRSITLPEGTQRDQIHAGFDDGLVEIVVEGVAGRSDSTRIELRDRPARRPPARWTDCSGAGSRRQPARRAGTAAAVDRAVEMGQELDLDEARLRKRA